MTLTPFRRKRSVITLGAAVVTVLTLVALLFLSLPIVSLVVRSVQNQAWEASVGSAIPAAIGLSIVTTIVSTILTAGFGTPLAYVLAHWPFPYKRFLTVLIELPIVLPPAVAGLALLVTFGRRGLLGGVLDELGIVLPFTTAAVILAQTFVSAPFYIRSALVAFQGIEREIEDAARVDGAGGLRLFWHITLPLARRALTAGLVLSWARAFGEFGATILFAGSLQGRTQTMPLLVYNILERNLDAAIWTGLLLVGVALAALLLSQWLSHKAE